MTNWPVHYSPFIVLRLLSVAIRHRVGPVTLSHTLLCFTACCLVSGLTQATSFTTPATSEPIITLSQGQEHYEIGEQILLVRDSDGALDASTVLAMETNEFFLSTQPVINIGVTQDVVWGRFKIDTTTASHWIEANKWVMFIKFPLISHIEFYAIDSNTGEPKLVSKSGSTLPMGASGTAHPFHIFSLPLAEESEIQTFLFRVQSDFSIQMPIFINNHRALLQTDIGLFVFWGLVFGVILALTVHLIFVIAVIGYKSIIYYLLFVISGSFLLACGNSITFYFLWPNDPDLNIKIIPASASIASLACLMFVKELLNLPALSKTLNNISNGFIVAVVISVLLPVFGSQDYTIVTVTSSVVISFYILFLTFYCMIKDLLIAKYLFFGWVAYLTGASLHVAVMHNLLPYNVYTIHAKEVAVVIEMFLVSLGLAQRTREAEREKRRALHRHREKSEALKHLGVAIEKPLSAIAQRIQYAQQTDRHTPQHKADLFEIREGSETLLCLVNDMLDIERMDAGKLELERIPFKLNDVINAALATVRFTAQEGAVELQKPTAHCLNNVYRGDPNRLRQVLTNLLGELIRQEGVSKIRFNVEFLSLKLNQSQLFFVVENLPTANSYKSNVEIPDLQVEATPEKNPAKLTEDKPASSPIELKLSEALLNIMGSELHTEIVDGMLISASFSLGLESLDRTTLTPETIQTYTQTHRTPFGTEPETPEHVKLEAIKYLNILVVDDDATNLKVMAEHLKDMGSSFHLAQGGHQALEKISTNRYDLVFMDLRMPNMDGFETTEMIRRRFSAAQLPIVALTADAYPEIQEKCFDVGMNGFLTRPLHAGEFEDLLYGYASQRCTNKPSIGKQNITRNKTTKLDKGSIQSTHPTATNYKLDLLYPLKELQWTPDMVQQQLQGFMQNYASYPEDIANAFKGGKHKQIRQIIHTIRGAAIAINASRLVYFIDRTKASLDNDTVTPDEIEQLTLALTEVIEACSESLNELELLSLASTE